MSRPLEKRIAKDYRAVQRRFNSLFHVYMREIGKIIEDAGKDTVGIVAQSLGHYEKINYRELDLHGVWDLLEKTLDRRWKLAAQVIEAYWTEKGRNFDLMSRLVVSFIAKKTSPPWIPNKVDLKSKVSKDGGFDPRMGHIRFYLQKMTDQIMNQVKQGALNEESVSRILARIRRMFNRGQGRVKEAEDPFKLNWTDPSETSDSTIARGPVDIEEGIFTLEDVDSFVADQRAAMQWEYRQYRPWFTDTLKSANRYLRDLEQLMGYSATTALHTGMISIGPKEMGIDDFAWVTATTETTCDVCMSRDGLTMKEIGEKIKDEYGDMTPPLHPNCRCAIVPAIKDSWSEDVLSQDGVEWDSNTGLIYQASDQEKDAGIRDMTWDEYLKNIPGVER